MSVAEFERATVSRETCPPGFSKAEAMQIPLGRFEEMLAMVLNDPSTPAPVRNAALAVVWFAQVEAFRALEDKFLICGEYNAELDDHRLVLSELLFSGEGLLAMIKSGGLIRTQFTVEDVAATLASLHTTFNCEHGPKNPPQVNQFVMSLFDGEKR